MIIGEKIGLRAVEKDDLERLRDWRNLPHFRKNFREIRELNMFNQIAWYERQSTNPNDFMFSIVDLTKDNELVGACGLLYINWVIRSADFSIYVGKDEEYLTADGFGGDASKTLLNYGFKVLNLNKIWMELYEFDSLKLQYFVDELGFHKDGKLRKNCFYDGRYYDSYIISILRDEFFFNNQ